MAHLGALGIFQALLTPLVAIVALGIAFAQWWTARNRLKLDLFDRRWAIYDVTRATLAEIFARQELSEERQRVFREAIRAANWLFDKDLDRYLRESLWPHVAFFATPIGEDELCSSDQCYWIRKHTREWVSAELPIVEKKFAFFLKLDEGFFGWLRERATAWR